MVLSSNYSQFIIDAAHAALFASMLVFFYFDRAHTQKKKARGQSDDEGTWGTMNKTQPATTESFLFDPSGSAGSLSGLSVA